MFLFEFSVRIVETEQILNHDVNKVEGHRSGIVKDKWDVQLLKGRNQM